MNEQDLERVAVELLALPSSSRVFLAEKLIESVEGYADSEIEDAWKLEAARRLAEYQSGQVTGIPAEDVFRTVRERLNEARDLSSAGSG